MRALHTIPLAGIIVVFASVLITTATHAQTTTAPTTAPVAQQLFGGTTAIIALHGHVDDYTRDSLFRKFTEARKLGAKTVILDLDTPGGLVTAGLDISIFLRGQNDLHIIAYVHPKAYSAGAMIAVACNEIVMAPSAAVGDCAPIVFSTDGNLQPMPAAERAKAQSPIVADFDASAARNGYDPVLLEAMVITERTVHWVQGPSGERRFVDENDYAALTARGWKPVAGVPDPIDGPDTLLTLGTDEAVKLGIARGVAESAEALAAERGLSIVADLTPGVGEQFVELINNAAVRGILMTLFFVSLYISIGSPGHGAAEAIATISLGLLVGIPLLTGYAQWWELAVIFGGLALLAFEVFVFPGHGVSAIVGIIMILGGLLLTFVGREPSGMPGVLPHFEETWRHVRQGLIAITGGLTASLLLSIWLRKYLPKLPYFNGLILTTTSGGTSPALAANAADVPPQNNWPGVGTVGRSVTELKPGGSAEFMDLSLGDSRIIAVISESGFIPPGSNIIVRESRGNRVIVRMAPV
jgi:membrane-bound serine protease (ClpP class)